MSVKNKTNCSFCKKEYIIKSGTKGLFCSSNCKHKSQIKGARVCCDCGGVTSLWKVKRCKTCEVRRRKGENHSGWKGALVSYRALHNWVVRELGQPDECVSCGAKGEKHKMHWANISGEYKRELTDWLRLCPACHGQYDKEKRLLK